MDEAVLHSDSGELDPGRIEQVTSLCFFPVVHAGLTGVFFLDRVRQQLGDGVSFSEYRCNVIAVYFCLFLREPAGISCPGYIPKAKGRRDILSTLAFLASRRACRPTAVFSIQLTWSHTRPASREARCRAAVKPRLSRFSSMPLRASAVTGAGL